jgi:hypothetical protein
MGGADTSMSAESIMLYLGNYACCFAGQGAGYNADDLGRMIPVYASALHK